MKQTEILSIILLYMHLVIEGSEASWILPRFKFYPSPDLYKLMKIKRDLILIEIFNLMLVDIK